MSVWYATREAVKTALDVAETARNNTQVDRAIGSASRTIEGACHRRFYPFTGTRYFDWPNAQGARPWRLWLDNNELISLTTLVAGGTTIAAADYFLRRADGEEAPPYTILEIDLASSAAFSSGSTHQRAIAITGVFGHSAETAPAGATAEVLDSSETGVDVTDSSAIGVGSVLMADSERMTVTAKTMADTTQNLGGNLTAAVNNVTVPVGSGAAFNVGETILIGSERMLVVDIAGNNLTVKRAWDGTVLAVHSTNDDVYAPRTLTVVRGDLGTTAASHITASPLTVHVVPDLIAEWCVAEAMVTLAQEDSAYARMVGSGENAVESAGVGLKDLREQALTAYGRRARSAAI